AIESKGQALSSAELNGNLTVLLARDEAAKRSFLSFVDHVFPGRRHGSNGSNGAVGATDAAWSGHLMLGTSSGIYRVEPSRLIASAERSAAASRFHTARPSRPAPRAISMRASEMRHLADLDGPALTEVLLGSGAEAPAALEDLRKR